MERISILSMILTATAIIFVGASMILPWWNVHLSPEAANALSDDFTVNYNILKSVTATSNSLNETVTVSLTNMTLPEQKNTYTFMDVTLGLCIAGLVLSIPLMLVSIIAQMAKHVKLIVVLGYLSATLLIISGVYFVAVLPESISSLRTLSPIDLPYGWPSITTNDTTSAWGAKAASSSSLLPTWWSLSSFWVWQPGVGWYMTFSAALLVATVSLVLNGVLQKGKRAFKRLPGVSSIDKQSTAEK